MKRVVFIGHIGKGFGNILSYLNKKFQKEKIEFIIFSCGKDTEENIKELNIFYFNFPSKNDLYFNAEPWHKLLRADAYILWNGYHGFYANLKNYFINNNIHYFLSEYTSVKNAYFFDLGLHAESTIKPYKNITSSLDTTLIRTYVESSPPKESEISELLLTKKIKILYLGLWDDAAGLTFPNNSKTKEGLSPYFKSSFQAAQKLVLNTSDDNIIILKPHPHDSKENKDKLKKLANNRVFYLDNVDIYQLIPFVDIVVTIASTTSVLAAYYRKPLIILGNTYITNSNYPIKYSSKKEFNDLIKAALLKNSIIDELSYNFFHYYLNNCNIYSNDLLLNSLGVKNVEEIYQEIQESLFKID